MARSVIHRTFFFLAAAAVCATAAAAAPPKTIPWAKLAGKPLAKRLSALHLHALGQEGQAEHIHAHLDLYVKGRRIQVPADIGIDVRQQFITELHTHDTTGVIHIESPVVTTFSLGQLFGEWGVKLTSRCVGPYCGAVHWWVNGKAKHGDPAAHVLRAHEEIVVAEGAAPFVVPKTYAFPLGE
jgi:hypothetical protein